MHILIAFIKHNQRIHLAQSVRPDSRTYAPGTNNLSVQIHLPCGTDLGRFLNELSTGMVSGKASRNEQRSAAAWLTTTPPSPKK